MRVVRCLSARGVSLALAVLLAAPPFVSARVPDAETQPAQSAPEQPPEEAEEQRPAETAPAPETAKPKAASLQGRILRANRRSPVPAAVVYAIAPDELVVSSSPADAKGRYLISGLAPGTYRIAVLTEEGIYALESPVGITSAHGFRVDLAVVPAEGARETIPGVAAEPRGFAYILQGKATAGANFWKSPRGVIVLVGTGLAGALLVSAADDGAEAKPVSPSSP
jgi:hypothetical protein